MLCILFYACKKIVILELEKGGIFAKQMCFVTVFLMHILFKVLVNLDIASQADDEAQTGGIKTQTKRLGRLHSPKTFWFAKIILHLMLF